MQCDGRLRRQADLIGQRGRHRVHLRPCRRRRHLGLERATHVNVDRVGVCVRLAAVRIAKAQTAVVCVVRRG